MQFIARACQGFALLCAAGFAAFAAHATVAADLTSQRAAYTRAVQAIDRGNWDEYSRLRPGLESYPLAIYLDYFKLARQRDPISSTQALDFLGRSADTPLANRLLGIYLGQSGKAQRWQDFLQAKPTEPNSIELKCYFFRAQLAEGETSLAWEGAERLWVQGSSLPTACDPLFSAWQGAGGLTDALVWTRLLNAFDARQQSLLTFVAGKSGEQLRPWATTLLSVYRQPDVLRTLTLPADSPYSADIASRGVALLATSSPETALIYWRDLQSQLPFSAEQARQVESAIALQSLFDRSDAHRDWLDGALARLRDDKLTGIRLRWALQEQDWVAVGKTLPLLSDAARSENVWRYWQAVLLERAGDSQAAKRQLADLADQRDYYGFLAADRLGRRYRFNHLRLASSDASAVVQLPALQRIEELMFHDEQRLAQSEWYKLLQDTTDRAGQQDLALLASQNGWHRMAIDAATRAEAWDALDQRFPMPYQATFQRNATKRQVPETELLAIARRESAFYPEAESPVGARGLMQVMPATAELVAASLRQPHRLADLSDIDHNVSLGSAYYRQLLDRYGGNRVYALAAYNAGPHRVDRWRERTGQGVPADVWIESIPFLETRHYVQAVLAYNVVFQYLAGEPQHLFTRQERRASFGGRTGD